MVLESFASKFLLCSNKYEKYKYIWKSKIVIIHAYIHGKKNIDLKPIHKKYLLKCIKKQSIL
jgi:hypothetical protein